jgi:cell division protein FtsN
MVVLVGIGLSAYFLYLRLGDPGASPGVAPQKPAEEGKTEALPPKGQVKAGPAPEAQKPKGPRFTFYTLLPEKELTLPEGEVRARKRSESLGRTKVNEYYFLQVGSFHSADDAEAIRTKLARLGVQAKLEKAEIGKVLWYRVRIGPFASLREVEAIRARLRQHRIDSVVQTSK